MTSAEDPICLSSSDEQEQGDDVDDDDEVEVVEVVPSASSSSNNNKDERRKPKKSKKRKNHDEAAARPTSPKSGTGIVPEVATSSSSSNKLLTTPRKAAAAAAASAPYTHNNNTTGGGGLLARLRRIVSPEANQGAATRTQDMMDTCEESSFAPRTLVAVAPPAASATATNDEYDDDEEDDDDDDIPDSDKKMPASKNYNNQNAEQQHYYQGEDELIIYPQASSSLSVASSASKQKRKTSSPQKRPVPAFDDASTTTNATNLISIRTSTTTTTTTGNDNNNDEEEGHPNYKMPDVTRTNGIRQWDSWRRVFSSPRDAFLDLIDNAMDASLHDSHHGKVHLHQLGSNGVILINNSHKAIPDLNDGVLVAYGSTKNQGTNAKQDAIGENGIGLKHGCAALSHCSIVVSRNNSKVSVGILAKRLQTEKGICLPSFSFNVVDLQDSEDDIYHHVEEAMKQNDKFAKVVQEDLASGDKSGMTLLVECTSLVFHEPWKKESHVFALFIPELLHTKNNNNGGDTEDDDDDDDDESVVIAEETTSTDINSAHGRATRSTTKEPAARFLDQVRMLLPKHYINVPQEGFDFFIDNSENTKGLERVHFSYWLHRLVELSKITVYVNNQTPVEEMNDDSWDTEGHPLNIYMGFDPTRIEKKQKTHMSLSIHSRRSGRMIEFHEDARGKLGLVNQTSVYSQGFTMIVDDVDGKLPLMPTKQGIAWSEEKHGHIFHHNFTTWLFSVARMYYDLQLKRFANRRTGLRNAILEHFVDIDQCVSDTQEASLDQKCLHEAELNTFTPEWKRILPTKGNPDKVVKIFPSCFARNEDKLDLLTEPFFHAGDETLFPISTQKQAKAAQRKAKKAAKGTGDEADPALPRKRQRRAPNRLEQEAEEASEDESTSETQSSSRKRKVRRKKTSKKRGNDSKKDSSDDDDDDDAKTIAELRNELGDKTMEIRQLAEEMDRAEQHHEVASSALQEENEQLKRDVQERDSLIARLRRELGEFRAQC